jgi:multiple sugar transport system permease protein
VKNRSILAWPFIAGLIFLIVLPALVAVALGFTNYSGVGETRFTGLENLGRLIGDAAFWRSFGNSLIYIAMSVPLRLTAVFLVALLLHDRFRGATAARAGAYLPTVVPDVAYGLLWLWILNPIYGPLTGALTALGVSSPHWLTDPWSARFGVALMSVFQIGEGLVIAMAARRALPPSVYEAAEVDGASRWMILTRVTLPMMAPVLVLLAVRDMILALQTNFVPTLLVTEGGPRYATTYLPVYVYQQAFRYFRLGYASAISLTMFVLTGLAIYIQYRVARRWKLI